MRRLWETIGGIALAIVAVSCSNDSASHGCESPCEEPDAQACYTFGSGENSLVARAKCELDEKAGCFQWNFVEACNETCENDVCDPECTEGKYACFGKTLKQCKKNAAGETTWDTIRTCTSNCKATAGKCSEELPSCTLTSGVTAIVRQWTDGDTVWSFPNLATHAMITNSMPKRIGGSKFVGEFAFTVSTRLNVVRGETNTTIIRVFGIPSTPTTTNDMGMSRGNGLMI